MKAPTPAKANAQPIGEILLTAQVLKNGSGGYVVTPGKPKQEVTTIEAARMLGVSRTTVWELRHDPVAGKILVWRYTSAHKRKVMFTAESVIAFLKYTKTLDK